MRIVIALCLLAVMPSICFAQQSISAETIINSINSNTAVSIADATITGDLDFSNLANKQLQSSQGSDKIYISTVEVPVSFVNCTFTGRVLGYYNPVIDKPSLKKVPVYNANFEDDVEFRNCVFEKDASFKYSTFDESLSFEGCRFESEAEFKYTNFDKGPVFKNAAFKDMAVFKYVTFPSGFDFSNVVFSGGADFKYAQFEHAGSFAGARFKNAANFKYAHFVKSVDFNGAAFEGDTDFKYATLNDHKTTPEELVGR